MNSNSQKKINLVNNVFNSVSSKYDLMNDIMSLGLHRVWKNRLIEWIAPNENQIFVDVATGTGDIPRLINKKNKNKSSIYCVEPNKRMLERGKSRLKDHKNIKWFNNSAEDLPFSDEMFDIYSISFGLRNTTDIPKTLDEAFRVLKPGGRFFCLEFSKVENEIINFFYDKYSKLLPQAGKIVVGNNEPYDYLVKSIKDFYNQEDLSKLLKNSRFEDVQYRNLASGIAAIHCGWKE